MKNPVNLSSLYQPIYCHSSYGPYFVGSNRTVFYVPANANTDTNSEFSIYDTYKDLPKAPNGKCMYIDGDANFQVSDFEVYKVISN